MHPPRLYEYLTKSRAEVFDRTRTLTPEQYAQVFPIGLGSLALTLHHVRAAEWCYVQRIIGRPGPLRDLLPEQDPEPNTPFPFGSLEQHWREQAEQSLAQLRGVTDWDTPLDVTTGSDELPRYLASRADVASQLVFHEVHHRAQAMNMLRHFGSPVGEIDFNALMYMTPGA
ncbi:MAG: DinB family protein [Planctomycetota bacterium]